MFDSVVPGSRPPPRGVSDEFEPELATVPDPLPEPVLLPVAGVLPLEPLLAVEVFPAELPPVAVVFVVAEPAFAFDVDALPVVVDREPVLLLDVLEVVVPALAFDVFDVDVLPVPVVREPVLPVDVFEVVVPAVAFDVFDVDVLLVPVVLEPVLPVDVFEVE